MESIFICIGHQSCEVSDFEIALCVQFYIKWLGKKASWAGVVCRGQILLCVYLVRKLIIILITKCGQASIQLSQILSARVPIIIVSRGGVIFVVKVSLIGEGSLVSPGVVRRVIGGRVVGVAAIGVVVGAEVSASIARIVSGSFFHDRASSFSHVVCFFLRNIVVLHSWDWSLLDDVLIDFIVHIPLLNRSILHPIFRDVFDI